MRSGRDALEADLAGGLPPDRPVLIAGPTASGKSDLAARIAACGGGVIVNADALQVFDGWRILTARPSLAEEAALPHALYGHVPLDATYSAGDWLRAVTPLLRGSKRPIIVGGTGLYFAALTCGLAAIPATPPTIRAAGDAMPLAALVAALDPGTAVDIDLKNRARVQRAWEVLQTTGRPLRDWQADTGPPPLPLSQATAIVLRPDIDWLNARIAGRFDAMLQAGALDEARALRPRWSPAHQSARAIGAAELIAHIDGHITLSEAREAAITATRQYAKRQRTWFRARMGDWRWVDLP